ncbi:MAG: hypothetical protein JWP01_952 [Myxococcales bacterium]|nr:hypothetical protein [Myxococcales bacterium]
MREYRRIARNRYESLGADCDAAVIERAPAGAGVADSDGAHALRRAIAELSQPLQEVLLLCDLGELTLAEAAVELVIPIDTAKDRLRRARHEVRVAIDRAQQEVDRV